MVVREGSGCHRPGPQQTRRKPAPKAEQPFRPSKLQHCTWHCLALEADVVLQPHLEQLLVGAQAVFEQRDRQPREDGLRLVAERELALIYADLAVLAIVVLQHAHIRARRGAKMQKYRHHLFILRSSSKTKSTKKGLLKVFLQNQTYHF